MSLWHLLARTTLPYEVLHVNFGLRGADSEADADLVRSTAQELGVVAHMHTAVLLNGARGTQAKARESRMAITERYFARCSMVLLAHHADDQAETILMKLARGTGGAGLVGMRPVNGRYLRPLLSISREALRAYAKTHDVQFREDVSNASDAYLRNRFRHHVLPALNSVEPRTITGIGLAAKHQADLVEFAFAQAPQVLETAILSRRPAQTTTSTASGPTTMYCRRTLAATRGLSIVINYWLEPLGFKRALVEAVTAWICDDLPHRRTVISELGGVRCVVSGRRVYVEPLPNDGQ